MLLAAVDFDNLHQVLRVLYDEMMPLCSTRNTWCKLSKSTAANNIGIPIYMLPVAFIRRAVESQHPVGVVLLLCPQVGHGYVLAGVVVHEVAVIQ